jgi:ceramide glucosyltransferase
VTTLAWGMIALCTTWIVLGLASVARVRFRTFARASSLPPVTVLKPLCGADPSLRKNLESFFLQDHVDVELLFGVEGSDDPAAGVVRELLAVHPQVRAKLVVHDGARAQNPKVRNLAAMLPHATHDLVVISDSNVRAPRGYVRELASVWADTPQVGLVTNLFAGEGGATFGAALESVQLCGFVAAGAALPSAFGDAAVIGKSMMFSRAKLESLGGLARVADVLAEDYLLGKMFQAGAGRVVLAPTILVNVVRGTSVRAFFARHLRWSMLRMRLCPYAFLLEPVTSPLVALPFAIHALGPGAVVWALAMWLLRDTGGWLLLRGSRSVVAPLVLAPLRDALMLAAWLATPFKRHVSWRGHRVRLGTGTLLFEELHDPR